MSLRRAHFVLLVGLLLLSGCGALSSDEVTRRMQEPLLLSRASVERQPPGTPQRTLFAWWRALQYADARAATRYYARSVGMTPGKLKRQLGLGAAALGLLGRPGLVDIEGDDRRATVMVVLETRTDNPNGRIDVTRTARSFDLVRTNGDWKLADNGYLRGAVQRLRRSIIEAARQQQSE